MNELTQCRRQFLGLVGAGVLATGTGSSAAAGRTTSGSRAVADSDWPTASGDAGHTGYNGGASPPVDGVAVDWQNHFVNADSRPVVVDGVVSLWDGDRILYDVDLETGSITDTANFPWGEPFPPTATEGRLHVGLGHSIFGSPIIIVDLDSPDETSWEHELGVRLSSAPAVVDGILCFRTMDGLRAVDFDSLDEARWTAEIDGTDTPAAADGTFYVADSSSDDDPTVYALDAETGDEQWTWSAEQFATDRVVVADGTAYVAIDGDGDEQTVAALDAATGDERWRSDIVGDIRGPLAVDDDTVYAATDGTWETGETLYALDASTGDERWQYRLDWESFTGQPVVAADTVYVATDEETIYAVDATDGTERWEATLPVGDDPTLALVGDRLLVSGTTLVALRPGDETSVAATADGLPVDWRYDHGGNYVSEYVSTVGDTAFLGSQDTVFAFDPTDGETTWSAAVEADGDAGKLRGAPVEFDDALHVATEDGVVEALETDGSDVRWRAELEADIAAGDGVAVGDGGTAVTTADGEVVAIDAEGTVRWRETVGNGVVAAPAVTGDTVVVKAETDDSGQVLYGLEAASGDERWQFDFSPSSRSDPVAVDGMVIAGNGDTVRAFDATDGTERWDHSIENPIHGATAADGMVYIATGNSSFYEQTGAVYAIEAATGDRRWVHRLGAVYAPPAVVGGTVYVGTQSGTTYALAADDGELLAWRYFGSSVNSLAGRDETLFVAFEDATDPVALDASGTVAPSLDLPWPNWAAVDAGAGSGSSDTGGGDTSGSDGDSSGSDDGTADDGDDSSPGFGVLGTAAGVAGAGLYRTLGPDSDGDA